MQMCKALGIYCTTRPGKLELVNKLFAAGASIRDVPRAAPAPSGESDQIDQDPGDKAEEAAT